MSVRSFIVRLTWKAAAVAAFVWTGNSVSAADVAPPPVVTAAPVTVGDPAMPGCESCQHGAIRAKCDVCGKLLGSNLRKIGHKKDPYPVTLCPGACFGYFQTQWRKWDEVCPYPYLGHGVTDNPKAPAGVLNPRVPGAGELNPPRPVDPKLMPDPKKVGSDAGPMIPIPVVPPNKFGP